MRDGHADQLAPHIAALRRYARVLAGTAGEADDLVQECLLRAVARLRVRREIEDLRAYLFTIMHNLFVDELARRRRQRPHVSIDSVAEAMVSCRPNQAGRLELSELSRGLDTLSAEQRQALTLIGVEGRSYREAAGLAGVPVGTVMSRLWRARRNLRHYMDGVNGKPSGRFPPKGP